LEIITLYAIPISNIVTQYYAFELDPFMIRKITLLNTNTATQTQPLEVDQNDNQPSQSRNFFPIHVVRLFGVKSRC